VTSSAGSKSEASEHILPRMAFAAKRSKPSPEFVDIIQRQVDKLFPSSTQYLVAERLGIRPSYWSNIMLRRVPPPSLGKVIAIANALGIDAAELAKLAGYNLGQAQEGAEASPADSLRLIASLTALRSNVDPSQISLDDFIAILLGRYMEIRSSQGLEGMLDFVDGELKAGLASKDDWEGTPGCVLRTYRRIGSHLLDIVKHGEAIRRNLEHLHRSRSGDQSNPDSYSVVFADKPARNGLAGEDPSPSQTSNVVQEAERT